MEPTRMLVTRLPDSSRGNGPPYPPSTASLGGVPELTPDVPISSIFLFLYAVFGIIHIMILKSNKARGHKFIFNGAILGLCKIRILTMCLRMAWASHVSNSGLAIAANTFVYAGTIILYMCNWFFVQRIVRAHHPKLGWSKAYRFFHRMVIVFSVLTLLMLIAGMIGQHLTRENELSRVFRSLQLTGQTYLTVFCYAPILIIIASLLIPKTEVEKFGAGRLRINLGILIASVIILSIGQIFRCTITWLPQIQLRDSAGNRVEPPWYLHKACFYTFNFVTEILVIILYAFTRVDLRFHIPDGSKVAGDYSGRNSRIAINTNNNGSEKTLNSTARFTSLRENNSKETLHQYENSVFDDAFTLADSLRYPSTTLSIDESTGTYKVKRVSGTNSSHGSDRSSNPSRSSINNTPFTANDDVPPVPDLPADWPLRDNSPPRSSIPVLEHSNPSSRGHGNRTFELDGHHLNGVDVGDAISRALASLEHNSVKNKRKTTPPPRYSDITHPALRSAVPPPIKPHRNVLHKRRRSTYPQQVLSTAPAPTVSKTRARRPTSAKTTADPPSPTLSEPTLKLPKPRAVALARPPTRGRPHVPYPSLEIIPLKPSASGAPRVLDATLQRSTLSSESMAEPEPVPELVTAPAHPASSRRRLRKVRPGPIPKLYVSTSTDVTAIQDEDEDEDEKEDDISPIETLASLESEVARMGDVSRVVSACEFPPPPPKREKSETASVCSCESGEGEGGRI